MKTRLLNISCYVGCAPLFWLKGLPQQEKNSVRHHCQQALALSFLLFLGLLIFVACFTLQQVILYMSRDLFKAIPLEMPFYVLGGFLIGHLGLWLVSVVSAARGIVANNIPWLSRITASQKRLKFSVGWTLLLQVSIVLLIIATMHASLLTKAEITEADVYMLYDDMGYIPRWVFTLGFYRVSLVATERWGAERVVVAPLSESAIDQALQNGRLVYIASHGSEGMIALTNEDFYWPRDVNSTSIGPHLQYVYLAGCDTGFLAEAWEQAFAPAEVKTFARLSSMTEHILWLVIDGPKTLLALE